MKIRDVFKSGRRTISFEFFPPRTEQAEATFARTIRRLQPYAPDYVSVTYGAGGSTRDKTVEMVTNIKRDTGLEAMSHLTCVAQTKEDVHNMLLSLEEAGIDNVLALRGDPPRAEENSTPVQGDFRYSSELITYIRENFEFGVAGSSFPEGHPDSEDLDMDIFYHKVKVESGADFLVTQLFFDNDDFFRFMERADKAGIDVPIVAGILPVLSTPQIRRFTSLCGAKIPPSLDEQLERFVDDDDSARDLGIEWATRQIDELWTNGVAGVHLYTLNRSYSASKILDSLDLPRG
jgi:methylenetetrahydrofolate reductase (NADPH)